MDMIRKLDPRPGLRYNKTQPRLVEPDVYFRKVDDQWQVFMNEDDMPQLRLSPVYRRLLVRDAADRDVRNYVKERFTAAIQLMKSIEQRKHTILRVCQSIIARQGEFLDARRRRAEAHDDQGSGGRSRRASFYREPRGFQQVRAHVARRAGAAVVFQRIGERPRGRRICRC